jgi:hypothetical protein
MEFDLSDGAHDFNNNIIGYYWIDNKNKTISIPAIMTNKRGQFRSLMINIRKKFKGWTIKFPNIVGERLIKILLKHNYKITKEYDEEMAEEYDVMYKQL